MFGVTTPAPTTAAQEYLEARVMGYSFPLATGTGGQSMEAPGRRQFYRCSWILRQRMGEPELVWRYLGSRTAPPWKQQSGNRRSTVVSVGTAVDMVNWPKWILFLKKFRGAICTKQSDDYHMRRTTTLKIKKSVMSSLKS